ncbi:Ferredoxin-NADP reductase [Friedmanniella luteola]|uniref:Ferredoxin-NADP reductase n=1 Tax=Friedmanniella luteola TaxID=546871 RepID=A0A1H1RGY6_9ACTN|nr:FAD-binding oxidoreductase [Friedmanniella luteola]SDS34169.1 Ferredoxin-NADP reductase [Friedmanniella luteola]
MLAPTAGPWRTATVREVAHPHPHGVVLRLEVPDRVDHLPGQHYVLRLTAEDGYTATRSYSLASAPSDPLVELYVEELPDGEVSPYLAQAVGPGDQLEVRGPIGGWFVWDATGPALGVAGGSGVVPLVAMLRHAADVGRPELLRLAVAARTLDGLPYADELRAAGALVALSREAGPDGRSAGRLLASELAPLLDDAATCFVCGSAPFAGGASDLLVGLGVDPGRVRVERFGASG